MAKVAFVGIDPGTSKTNPLAIAVLFVNSSDCSIDGSVHYEIEFGDVDFGVKALQAFHRVQGIVGGVIDMSISTHFFIERPFVGRSRNGAITLAAMYGAIVTGIATVAGGMDIKDIAPMQAKKYFTGSGKAQKKDVIARAKELLGIDVSKDVADAYMFAYAGMIECQESKM